MLLEKATVESVTCYGCEISIIMRERSKEIPSSRGELFKISQSMKITKQSQTSPLGTKCKQKNQLKTEFKQGNLNGMGTSSEWMIVVRRRSMNRHRRVGREQKDRKNHRRTKCQSLRRINIERHICGIWERIDCSYLCRFKK